MCLSLSVKTVFSYVNHSTWRFFFGIRTRTRGSTKIVPLTSFKCSTLGYHICVATKTSYGPCLPQYPTQSHHAWLQHPSTPVGTVVTPNCNHLINCNRDSGKHVGLSAKRRIKDVNVFGVNSLTDAKELGTHLHSQPG
ncbi:hypothetical protein TNCV_4618441 [Trichonephila clavipes]|nr:hypothetical protein TNCV_4618441 [Trichonephila clavipes]